MPSWLRREGFLTGASFLLIGASLAGFLFWMSRGESASTTLTIQSPSSAPSSAEEISRQGPDPSVLDSTKDRPKAPRRDGGAKTKTPPLATVVPSFTGEYRPALLQLGGLTTAYHAVHTNRRELRPEAVVPLPPREVFNWDDPNHGAIGVWLKAWEKRLATGQTSNPQELATLTSLLADSTSPSLNTPPNTSTSPLSCVQLRRLGHAAEFLEPGPLAVTFYRAAIQQAEHDLKNLSIDSPEAQHTYEAIALCYRPFWDLREEATMERAFRLMLPFQPTGSYEAYKCITYSVYGDYLLAARGEAAAAERALAAYQTILDEPKFSALPAKELADVHLHMGYVLFRIGRAGEAVARFKAGRGADDYHPDSVLPMLVRGCVDLGQLDEAGQYLKDYVETCKPPPEAAAQLAGIIESAKAKQSKPEPPKPAEAERPAP